MTADKINRILQLINSDESFENYFFDKLATSTDPFEWLIPLKEAGYFAPEKNPPPHEVPNKKGYYNVPHWNILDALDNIAAKNAQNPDAEISRVFSEIVDGIIEYRDKKGNRIDNYRTDWKLLETISKLPKKYISSKHIQFIKEALRPKIGSALLDSEIGKLFLPKLIKEKSVKLIHELLDVILHYSKSNMKYSDKYISVIDPYYLKEALEKNKAGIAKLCSIEAAKVALSKIHEITSEDEFQFNYIWIPTIEDHEQTSFPDRYECQLVYFVRDMLEVAKAKKIEPMIKDMLLEEHDIFKRIAYHLINYHYNALSHLFWDISCNPLNSLSTHELFELFKAHCKRFKVKQIKTVLNWIETQDFDFSDEVSGTPEKEEYIKAYYKKEWLLALLDSNNKEVIRRYEKYHAINDATIEHPGFHYWSSGAGWVESVSPVDEDEFMKMTNAQISAFINSYNEEDEISWKDHTRVNLAYSIRKFVSNSPVRFSMDLIPFLSVPPKYQYELLSGLNEAWRNNRDFEWNELFPFMKKLIGSNKFWRNEQDERGHDYNRLIIGTISDLIQEGTRNDKHAFAPELLPVAEQIILIFLKKVKSDMNTMNDLVTSVLNSSKGKVVIAAILHSLRYARLYCQSKENRWIDSIKSEFTKHLNKTKKPGLEFSIVIGWHLPYLDYLDRQWVINNINRIFDMKSEKHWEAAFIGYIVMTSTVYEGIYQLLRENGHYEKALSCTFRDKHAEEKLVQNITIGYLAGWDDLGDENGLLRKMLKTDKIEYISQLVTFIWTYRDKDDKELRSKIKPLWKATIEKVMPEIENQDYRKIASNLVKWLSLVDTIDDDIFEWLQVSVEAIEENWNSGYFIECLLKHVSNTPAVVGKLYMKMLDTETYPDYKQEDIVAVVQALYDLNERGTADRICNLYLAKGFKFLKETYEVNRGKNVTME